MNYGHLVRNARAILTENRAGNGITKPSNRLYPHQWSWDAAFIAMGYAHIDPSQAMTEIRRLFDGMWKNGLLPHIVFSEGDQHYFPGPGVWKTDVSVDASSQAQTSGIVNPPVHATAAWHICNLLEDQYEAESWAKEVYPMLSKWHNYLYRERDPANEGLVYIRHPWESGMDNAPAWDAIWQSMFLHPEDLPVYERVDDTIINGSDRPTRPEYDRFIWLVRLFADHKYDETSIRAHCPFLVQDVLFNTLLCQAERDLASIAEMAGENPGFHRDRAAKTSTAVNEKMWDAKNGLYCNINLAEGRKIRVNQLSCYLPLFAGIPDMPQAERLLDNLNSFGFISTDHFSAPSFGPNAFGFSPSRYWRGPVWVNMNWLLIRGLARYNRHKEANKVFLDTLKLVEEYGFFEYFDPFEGTGRGTDRFSWTAALIVDLIFRPPLQT